jgi:hypothetical protein
MTLHHGVTKLVVLIAVVAMGRRKHITIKAVHDFNEAGIKEKSEHQSGMDKYLLSPAFPYLSISINL